MADRHDYRRGLVKLVQSVGGTLEVTNGGHYVIRVDGCPPMFCSFSPRIASRTLANVRARVLREVRNRRRPDTTPNP